MSVRRCASCGCLLIPNGQGMPTRDGKSIVCNRREVERTVTRGGERQLLFVKMPTGCVA